MERAFEKKAQRKIDTSRSTSYTRSRSREANSTTIDKKRPKHLDLFLPNAFCAGAPRKFWVFGLASFSSSTTASISGRTTDRVPSLIIGCAPSALWNIHRIWRGRHVKRTDDVGRMWKRSRMSEFGFCSVHCIQAFYIIIKNAFAMILSKV